MLKTNINSKSRQGFTIIEVVLVLAIAGLIFLMVFIALPALQASQRDTQRRQDMARFASQIAQYQANNNGNPPKKVAEVNNLISKYLKSGGQTFADPNGTDYSLGTNSSGEAIVTTCSSDSCALPDGAKKETTATGKIWYFVNATCNGEVPKYESGSRKVAFIYKLEGSGTYCGHN